MTEPLKIWLGFCLQFKHPENMVFPGTSTNRTIQQESDSFSWIKDELNRTLLKKLFCLSFTEVVIIWILFFIEFIVISLAVYGLCRLNRSLQDVSIFIANLFISDIIQICFRPLLNLCTPSVRPELLWSIYIISVLANIGFMVCISLERYVMITYPIWYRFHHSLKYSFPLCLLVWTIPVFGVWIIWILVFKKLLEYAFFLSVIPFLVPYPLVVFCFVGSWRALSHSVSVTPEEQKRILWILALVLFNYTVLFLPSIVQCIFFAMSVENGQNSQLDYLQAVPGILMYLNPLADCLLYVFMRKDANSILRLLCCKKLSENQVQSSHSLTRRGNKEIRVQAAGLCDEWYWRSLM